MQPRLAQDVAERRVPAPVTAARHEHGQGFTNHTFPTSPARASLSGKTPVPAPATSIPAARSVDVVARAVGEVGVPPERRVDAVRAVRSAVHGFVMLEATGGFGMSDDLEASFDYLVSGLVGALDRTSASQRS